MDGVATTVRADIYNESSPGILQPTVTRNLTVAPNGWVQSSVPITGERINILFYVVSGGGDLGTYCYGVNVNNQSNDGMSNPALYSPLIN